MVDQDVSIEVPVEKIKASPPHPTMQTEVSSPQRTFEHSQKVELKWLMTVECFEIANFGRKIVNSKRFYTYKGDEFVYFIKTKSRLVTKGFAQVHDVDYHDTTSLTPVSAPVKNITEIANELGLLVFHLDVSRAFVQVSQTSVVSS